MTFLREVGGEECGSMDDPQASDEEEERGKKFWKKVEPWIEPAI